MTQMTQWPVWQEASQTIDRMVYFKEKFVEVVVTEISALLHPIIYCDSYLCRITIGSSGGLAHGEGHIGDGPLGDGDAVDELLRGGVHGVHPAHHLLQVHPHPRLQLWQGGWGVVRGLSSASNFLPVTDHSCLVSPDCCPVPIMFCCIVTTVDCYAVLVLLL